MANPNLEEDGFQHSYGDSLEQFRSTFEHLQVNNSPKWAYQNSIHTTPSQSIWYPSPDFHSAPASSSIAPSFKSGSMDPLDLGPAAVVPRIPHFQNVSTGTKLQMSVDTETECPILSTIPSYSLWSKASYPYVKKTSHSLQSSPRLPKYLSSQTNTAPCSPSLTPSLMRTDSTTSTESRFTMSSPGYIVSTVLY